MSEIDLHYGGMNDDTEENEEKYESEIAKYFAGKTLFITGVTGFMGKCLIEKLLRSCPDIKWIYVLMREKKNLTFKEVVKKYFQHVIFDLLREANPNFHNKVIIVKGDLLADNLGMSDEDKYKITNEVDVIFHNAANVKFDIKISLSLQVNVLGTKKMLELAKECKLLQIFMYISTAYSHCYKKKIEEEFYSSPANLEQVHKAIKDDLATESGLSEKAVEQLIAPFPNIYTFTKAIAEDLVRQYAMDSLYAYGIYRPSIVTSSFREPLIGWCDNTNGPVNIVLGAGLGILHTAYHYGYPIDFIPSDMSINALLAITRDCCKRWKKERQAVIYNYSSSTLNPTSLPELYNFMKYEEEEGSARAVWVNCILFTKYEWLFYICHVLWHGIPACFLDILLVCMCKKPRALSLFLKATKHLDKVDYFGNGNWRIHMSETIKVIDKMNSTDSQLFYCDIRTLNWQEYINVMWRGLRYYILKEDLQSDAGYRRRKVLWCLHYALIFIVAFIVTFYLFKIYNFIFST